MSVHRSVVERLRPQFFTDLHQILHAARKFDCFEGYLRDMQNPIFGIFLDYGSEMWSATCLLFLRQTGSRHTILEVCEFRFWEFRNCACHVFPRIVTKIRTDLKLICIDFISSIKEIKVDFRDVQNPILAVSRLWWTYFPMDRLKNPTWVKTNQRWLCTRRSKKPELLFGFQRGANFVFGFIRSWTIRLRNQFFTWYHKILRAAA